MPEDRNMAQDMYRSAPLFVAAEPVVDSFYRTQAYYTFASALHRPILKTLICHPPTH